MPEILSIEFGIADTDEALTAAASNIFQSVGWRNTRLFLEDELYNQVNVLGVGYLGHKAIVAASLTEAVEPSIPRVDYTSETKRYLDVPYIAIRGLATAEGYRRQGYGSEMVKAVLSIAKDNGYHRVSASDVIAPPSETFWRRNRFVQPPRLSHRDDLVRETAVPIGEVSAVVSISRSVESRLSSFSNRDLSGSGQRLK